MYNRLASSSTQGTCVDLILVHMAPKSIRNLVYDRESELHRCVKSWRENAGYLKDIPIHIVTDSDIHIPSCTTHKFKFRDSTSSKFGYACVHEACKYISDLYPNNIHIHIDEDMEILKPLPISWFHHDCTIGSYKKGEVSDTVRDELCLKNNIGHIINTDIIITRPGCKFYDEYLSTYNVNDDTFWGYEEYVADLVVKNGNYNIISDYESCFDVF